MDFKAFLKRYSLLVYFVLAYFIAWGGILLVAAQKGFNPRAIELNDGVLMFFAMALGPSLSSLILTVLLEGRGGLRELFSRMGKWRVGLKWYAFILIIPITSLSIFLILSVLASKAYAPSANILFGIVIGGLAGFLEETGWTGFALLRLQSKFSIFVSGLILGLLWALWHIMADFWGNFANFGANWLPTFIVYWIVPLTAYRILMAYAYKNTNSLLLAQLMHMFYTGTLVAVSPTSLSVTEGWLWQIPFGIVLWIVVLAIFKGTEK